MAQLNITLKYKVSLGINKTEIMKDKITAEDMIESLGLLKPKLTLYSVVVSFFKRLKSKYTMTYKRSLFVDTVNGKMVNEYEDCYKNIFIAQSRLGWRIRKN